MSKLRWQPENRGWSGHVLVGYIGSAKAFTIGYDPNTGKSSNNKYFLNCYLTGFKTDMKHWTDEDKAKERAEAILVKWFEHTGLRFDD